MSELADTWMTPHEQHRGMLFFFLLLYYVMLAATLFTPESPEVGCGLKHFIKPSIGIVVSR